MAAVGSAVTKIKPGDAVYGVHDIRPAVLYEGPGWCSEYVVAAESTLLPKPAAISFEDAAALPGLTVTAYQSFKSALKLMEGPDSLAGKTVYIPGALSGTGSIGVQMAKNVYGAEKVISTVSTPKVPLVESYLPGLVDQVIDYKTEKLLDKVPAGSVDVVYNTQWHTMRPAIPLLEPTGGVLVSITSVPPSREIKRLLDTPWWINWVIDLFQLWYRFLLRGTNIKFEMISGNTAIVEDLEQVGEFIATGKIKAVMRVVDLSDIEAVRRECEMVNSGKGGIGKLVVKIV